MKLSWTVVVHGIKHCLDSNMSMLWLNGIPFNKLFISFLTPGGSIRNGVFFMLTGYFMYAKEYKLRRLVKLILQVYFYAIFLLLSWLIIRFLHIYNFNELGIFSQAKFFINAIIPITSGTWWFIQTYVVLFLFIPVLNNLLCKLNSKYFLLTLIFVWIFWLAPITFGFAYSNLQMAVFFYILGAWLKQSNFSMNKWLSLFLFCIIWLILFFLDVKTSQILESENITKKLLKFIYNGFSVVVFIPFAVIFLFAFCKNMNIRNSNIINKIASTTFGIYLIHDSSIGRQFIWNKIFHCLDIQYKSQYFSLIAISTILVVFCTCSAIDYLRQIIVEKKLLEFVNLKIDNIIENAKKF